jgi:hypothetical protein
MRQLTLALHGQADRLPLFGRRPLARVIRQSLLLAPLTALVLAGVGCDKAAELLIEKDVPPAANPLGKFKDFAASPNQATLQLDKAYQASCKGTIYQFEAPRQTVLQLNSGDSNADRYPFFLAQVAVASAAEIAAGSQLKAVVFLQEKPEAAVWESPLDELVDFKITTAGGGYIEGEITGAMICSDDGARRDLSGTFKGSLTQLPAK